MDLKLFLKCEMLSRLATIHKGKEFDQWNIMVHSMDVQAYNAQ